LTATLGLTALDSQAQTRSIPIRWCVVAGAPAASNPAGVGEPDADNVLWRRHERISEATYIPSADVTLRSGLWNIVESSDLNFPVIADPDTSDPDHQPGDILDPVDFSSDEWDAAYDACVEEWADELGVDDMGIVAVVARRIVDDDGDPTVFAWGWFGARRTLLEDNSWSFCDSTTADPGVCDGVDKTFGHEVAHTLPTTATGLTTTEGIRHTCSNANMMRTGRRDTTGDGELDNFGISTSIAQITGNGGDNAQCTGDDATETVDQPELIYAAGGEVPGCVNAGTNDSCGTQMADVQSDIRDDVDVSSVDLASARIIDSSEGTTRIVHELSGKIDPALLPGTVLEYFSFLDTDNDPDTGADPDSLGIQTDFRGAEIVTRVIVSNIVIEALPPGSSASQVSTPLFGASATVWVAKAGQFSPTDANGIFARVSPLVAVGEGFDGNPRYSHTADRVEITIPNTVRGPVAMPMRLHALSRATDNNAGTIEIDQLESEGEGIGALMRLRLPKFPLCSVMPKPIFAGGFAQVDVTGLIPNRGVHVVFGKDLVANGMADASGAASVSFSVPPGAVPGKHLVTVGTDETALTADCITEVTAEEARFEYAAKLICGVQPNTRDLRLARGLYATSINIHNPGRRARLFAKIALSNPPGGLKPGEIRPIGNFDLGHDQAMEISCEDIKREVYNGRLPARNIEGFVVVQSTQSLDVEGVYTTAALNAEGTAEGHSSIVVRRIPERMTQKPEIPPTGEPEKKADLIIKEIDMRSLSVSCPNGAGSCVTKVDVIVENIGDAPAGAFKTMITLDPNQSVEVIEAIPGGLAPGAQQTLPISTPRGGNCFDPDCTICAEADVGDNVDESLENNNTLCRVRQG